MKGPPTVFLPFQSSLFHWSLRKTTVLLFCFPLHHHPSRRTPHPYSLGLLNTSFHHQYHSRYSNGLLAPILRVQDIMAHNSIQILPLGHSMTLISPIQRYPCCFVLQNWSTHLLLSHTLEKRGLLIGTKLRSLVFRAAGESFSLDIIEMGRVEVIRAPIERRITKGAHWIDEKAKVWQEQVWRG